VVFLERGYLTISQAKLLGIGRTTIRRHEGGLFPVFERDEAGGRLFTKADLKQMKRVLKEGR
jgi:DNA-binding transcriptional MerR regulator